MPSFDTASEVNMHELNNALDQSNREIETRYDFKGADAHIDINDNVLTMSAESEFQLKQMADILYAKLAKRNVDIKSLEAGKIEIGGKKATQKITVRQGIDAETARAIVKYIKDAKLKVQAAILGDKVRVTGKKKDDLQTVIAALRQHDFGLPLQFINFRE